MKKQPKKLTDQPPAERLKRLITNGYHDRDDYPPYALMPWDDRNRFTEYVFKVIDDFFKEG